MLRLVAVLVVLAALLTGSAPDLHPALGLLAPTPPMGWSSWNRFGCAVDEQVVQQAADAMVASGMRAAGYRYVNVDDCWMAPVRDAAGRLAADPVRFPHGIAALARYLHDRGLLLGLYSSAGETTCAGLPASLGHEDLDAATFAAWGVDYLKYDHCGSDAETAPARVQAMAEALAKTDRTIVLAVSDLGQNEAWRWGAGVGAQLWRTAPDIADDFASVLSILDRQAALGGYARPGGWNDPDSLEVGNGGMTEAEYRAHFALWAVLNAPLIAGNDLRSMNQDTARILLNPDLIAVDRDWAGVSGRLACTVGSVQAWVKPMSDGSAAVVLLNRGASPAEAGFAARCLGLPANGPYRVRDLWTGQQRETVALRYGSVPAQSALAYRVWAAR
ncbi:hypothetical protein GCM10010174_90410 [Kutzneria viridogrisea]|uniref:Alpha-galactosidase n=1 Tax=Kutzneria viridogrisea TaxID=47990 RepID=A0ABR6BW08_9PSEU|nr:alpha-galactosidase [Kutzneria viridogrisea]